MIKRNSWLKVAKDTPMMSYTHSTFLTGYNPNMVAQKDIYFKAFLPEYDIKTLKDNTQVYHTLQGSIYVHNLIEVKRKTLPKDKKELVEKGSVWKTTETGFFLFSNGEYNSYEVKDVPVGTVFNIVENVKMGAPNHLMRGSEAYVSHDNPDFPEWISVTSLAHADCIKEANTESKFKLLDKNDKAVTPKSFSSYEQALNSARYHLKEKNIGGRGIQVKEFNGWKIVEYGNKKTIRNVSDLSNWYLNEYPLEK